MTTHAELDFFSGHMDALPLYEGFRDRMLQIEPDTHLKVQKTQIGFYNRHLYACVSFMLNRRTGGFTLTLGLPYRLDSSMVAAVSEPYPGRWTHHIRIDGGDRMDDELFSLLAEAADWADAKR